MLFVMPFILPFIMPNGKIKLHYYLTRHLFCIFNYRNMANYKPIKKTVNVRLDADIIEWLQSAGRGYQTRMNAILREAMLHSV